MIQFIQAYWWAMLIGVLMVGFVWRKSRRDPPRH